MLAVPAVCHRQCIFSRSEALSKSVVPEVGRTASLGVVRTSRVAAKQKWAVGGDRRPC